MTDKITILIVDDAVDTRNSLQALLSLEPDFEVVGTASSGVEAIVKAEKLKPLVITMDINMPDMNGIEAVKHIKAKSPFTEIIMITSQDDMAYIRRAMRAGAREFLVKPPHSDELAKTVRKVAETGRANLARLSAIRPLGSTGQSVTEQEPGQIILVYSPQGGAGCTTIATNLAAGLHQKTTRVLLIDADLLFGDIATFLNIKPQSNITDLVESANELDMDMFKNVVIEHGTGLKVLLSPPSPEKADIVRQKPESITDLLKQVSTEYDYIVVDTHHYLDDMLISILEIASMVMLVFTPELPPVRNIRATLDLFDKLNFDRDRNVIVLNHTLPPKADRLQIKIMKQLRVATPSIENFLKQKVMQEIPHMQAPFLQSINKGIPVINLIRDKATSPVVELLMLAERVVEHFDKGKAE